MNKALSPLQWHRPLMLFVAGMLAVAIVSVGGLFFDDRMLDGEAIWVKPLKFGVAMALYGLTLAWLLSRQQRFRRTGWWLGTVPAVTMTFDVGFIVIQTVRGRYSHFNSESDPFNQFMQPLFADAVGLALLAMIGLGVLMLFERGGDRAITSSIRLGLLLTIVGMGLGFLMPANISAEQAAADKAGTGILHGAHTVGAPDGGPGMPITHWSTVGGDLRIPHFLGMHSLQVIPLLAMVLALLATRLPALRAEGTRLGLVRVAGAGYAGLLALVTWQALRGQSLVHPDGTTLLAATGLVAATALAATAVLVTGRRRPAAPLPTGEAVQARAAAAAR
ncbi:hypothetical protein F0L68_22245 [Solihabitans fulvus]|uniref:Uncharacterized protein n=1 Tax=Solihabitans fulvus TaxID=1892852 RepID=A0A5B2X659_9PSEU|nr:hypothetical protein [Solihabitans fulvus]KAA2258579.1 hypothetical protein F0L68_22245 [Solihabitans fulvus]